MSKYLNTKKQNIAKTLITLNDSLRVKYLVEKYLTNYKLVDNSRLNLVYSGYYNKSLITVMSSGAGMASMGIYASELYEDYDIENIINIGFCKSYYEKIKLKDLILVEKAYTDSNYSYQFCGNLVSITKSSSYLNSKIINKSFEKDITIKLGNINTTDIYKGRFFNSEIKENRCLGQEMEVFSLLYISNQYKKDATSIEIVSENLVTKEELTKEEKDKVFDEVFLLVLDAIK